MASPTQWAWVWINSGSWWWTGRPGVLQSMGSQRVGHDWVTGLNWINNNADIFSCDYFKGHELNLLLEIGFVNVCLVLNSFPMTTPKEFLHALGGQVFLTLWNENISCHINKQDMSQPSAISGLQMWMRAPQTVIQRMLPPPMVTAEELEEGKKQGELGNRVGPRELKFIRKEWMQWA